MDVIKQICEQDKAIYRAAFMDQKTQICEQDKAFCGFSDSQTRDGAVYLAVYFFHLLQLRSDSTESRAVGVLLPTERGCRRDLGCTEPVGTINGGMNLVVRYLN